MRTCSIRRSQDPWTDGGQAAGAGAAWLARSPKCKELVKISTDYVLKPRNLPAANVKALSTAYGNFDRVVAAGWFLADAVGLPLLERGDALAAGLKAKREAVRITTEHDNLKLAAQRASGRLAADDKEREALMNKAAIEQGKRLSETADLSFHMSAAPAQVPKLTGSRKCAHRCEEDDAAELEQRIEKKNDG